MSSPIPPPGNGDPDEFVKELEQDVADLERREQQGESPSVEDRAALIRGRSWLVMHKFAATVQEHAPEKIETVYSSEHDRRLSQATMRVIRREQNQRRQRSVTVTPRARERRPVTRRRSSSSSSTAGADPGDPDGESSEDDDAARLRGFLVYLIGFDWSEALIDSAYAFSVEIEREVTS